MEVAAFYHVWAGGRWVTPLTEFQEALNESGFDSRVSYVVVGYPNKIEWDEHGVAYDQWQASGFEEVTINALRLYAQEHDGAVLYAHTKGSARVCEYNDLWRRSMTEHVVSRWRENLQLLEEHDVVGCHYLERAGATLDGWHPSWQDPMFAGNFWMARCDYLRKLPECTWWPRYAAEGWVARGNPRYVDLLPGWPSEHWPDAVGGPGRVKAS